MSCHWFIWWPVLIGFATAALVVPDGFEVRMIATNLNPTSIRTAPDGRIFLCEKHGALRVIKNETLLKEPVLTITTLSTWNERGLIGVAFDPDFETNSWLYVQYTWTDGTQVKARVSRFTLDGDVALEGSETVIFESDPYSTDAGMHNGGSLVIDNDGKMFVFVGDIFDQNLSPDLNKTFGKVFRINLDGTIPEDNPYYNTLSGIRRAIWASGLRNPFMTAYNPDTDQTIIGDVGEGAWEELNLNRKGANYGWPRVEGFTVRLTNYTNPELAYNHGMTGCAITGLAFYRNLTDAQFLFPATYHNKLFFGDYCKGWIRYIDINGSIGVRNLTSYEINTWAPTIVKGTAGGLSMTQGLDGGLYFTERGTFYGAYTTNMGVLTGSVYKLIYTGSRAPVIYQQLEQWPPLPTGKNYTLVVGATGAAPLTYQWFRGDEPLPLATNESLVVLWQSAMNGTRYRVEVSNPNGTVTSNEVVMLVSGTAGLGVSIWTSQSMYSAGDVIRFRANITDPTNDPIRLISWVVELKHQAHTHPFTSFSNIQSGNFTIPIKGEVDPVQWYTIWAYVQNSLFSTVSGKSLSPNLGKISVATNPLGLYLLVDDVQTYFTSAQNITGVSRMERIFYAPGSQSLGNNTFKFIGWSDGEVNNERGVVFTSIVMQVLIANYCTVGVNCPESPVASPTQIPIGEPISVGPEAEPVSSEPSQIPPAAEPHSEVLVPTNEPAEQAKQPDGPSGLSITSNAHKEIIQVAWQFFVGCLIALLFVNM